MTDNEKNSNRSRQRGQLTAKRLERAESDRRAIELRNNGATFDEIATTIGIPGGKGSAYRAVQRALQRRAAADIEELRATELSRTDEILDHVLPLVMVDPPDLGAVDRVMKVLDYRARIIGLYAPQRQLIGVEIDAKIDLRAIEAHELLEKHPKLAVVIDKALDTGPTNKPDDREATGDD